MNGDFKQGGWEGFAAYSLQPQNNPIGATLMARSDLQSRIATKKASVDADLNRGNGFLSWQKCTDVPMGNSGPVDDQDEAHVTKTVKKCSTQTPGSIIGGSLQRSLNVPEDKLVLVKTISDSIDAILGALMNQMLTQGLAAISGKGSSTNGKSGQSYLSQLYEEADNTNSADAQNIRNRNNTSTNAVLNLTQNAVVFYQQSIDLLNASKSNFVTARQCFVTKMASMSLTSQQNNFAQNQINAINTIIARDIDPLISSTTVKKAEAQAQVSAFSAAIDVATNGTTTVPNFNSNYIDTGFGKVETVVNTGTRATQAGIESSASAQQEYTANQTKTTALNKIAQTYQTSCDQFPYHTGGY